MTKFNYFKDIKNSNLRFWNISVTFSNLYKDFGATTAKEYAENLSTQERAIVYRILHEITEKGHEYVRKTLLKDVSFDNEAYDNAVAKVKMENGT